METTNYAKLNYRSLMVEVMDVNLSWLLYLQGSVYA